jgi:hypothetical protein
MLEYSPLPGNDSGDLLAMPFRLSPRGKEKVMPSAMFVIGISLEVAEHTQCSPEVAQRSGWRGSERSLYSCLSIAGLCGTGRAPSHDRSEQ